MSKLKTVIVGMSGLVFAAHAFAQAPISDVGQRYDAPAQESYESAYPGSAGAYPAQDYGSQEIQANVSQPVSGSAGILNTVNQLQEEVANLRGQVEELTHQVERMKQQQLEDYSRLDQMIAGGAGAAAAVDTSGAIDASQTPVAPKTHVTSDGKAEYDAAYALLRAKKLSEAEVGFNTLISNYPNSTYSGNANFWLGFIYQTRGDLTASEKAFNEVLKFPKHNKEEDAKYNLGKVYHLQGKTEEARKLLTEVAAGSSNTANLAKTYLATM